MGDSHDYKLPDSSLPVLNIKNEPQTEATNTDPHSQPPEAFISAGKTAPEPYIALIEQYQAENHKRYTLDKERIALEQEKEVRERKKIRLERAVLFCVVLTTLFTFFQWWAMYDTLVEIRRQTPAMIRAADVARDSLNEAQMSTDTAEVDNKRTFEQNQAAMNASIAQAKATLNVSIENTRLDQRAWVSIVSIQTVGGVQTRTNFTVESLSLMVTNSGKTPALRFNLHPFLNASRLYTDPIPGDYDVEMKKVEEFRTSIRQREREKILRLDPEMAEEIAKHEALDKQYADARPEPAGVLGPSAAQNIWIAAGKANWGRRTQDDKPRTIYILGKITYYDIFDGTPQHTTKFCLAYDMGTTFGFCSQGNSMD